GLGRGASMRSGIAVRSGVGPAEHAVTKYRAGDMGAVGIAVSPAAASAARPGIATNHTTPDVQMDGCRITGIHAGVTHGHDLPGAIQTKVGLDKVLVHGDVAACHAVGQRWLVLGLDPRYLGNESELFQHPLRRNQLKLGATPT